MVDAIKQIELRGWQMVFIKYTQLVDINSSSSRPFISKNLKSYCPLICLTLLPETHYICTAFFTDVVCSESSCQNSGTCEIDGTCTCETGYGGDFCESKLSLFRPDISSKI